MLIYGNSRFERKLVRCPPKAVSKQTWQDYLSFQRTTIPDLLSVAACLHKFKDETGSIRQTKSVFPQNVVMIGKI